MVALQDRVLAGGLDIVGALLESLVLSRAGEWSIVARRDSALDGREIVGALLESFVLSRAGEWSMVARRALADGRDIVGVVLCSSSYPSRLPEDRLRLPPIPGRVIRCIADLAGDNALPLPLVLSVGLVTSALWTGSVVVPPLSL